MIRTPPLHFAVFTLLLLATRSTFGQAYNPNSDALVQQYATSVNLTDIDGDGAITDMDFSVWAIERVFSHDVADMNCDAALDQVDAVLTVARELAGLTADFDDSEMVDGNDLTYVFDQIGSTNVGAGDGDLNGDDVVDAADVAEAVGKWGSEPALNPIDVAVDLLSPLLDINELNLPVALPVTPGCPAPETCGSATCKAKCQDSDTGVKWTYRLFMVGFCGSQFEADDCCAAAAAVACGCSPDGFEFSCWIAAQGTYVTCLLAVPG